jgi:hypothetical protein
VHGALSVGSGRRQADGWQGEDFGRGGGLSNEHLNIHGITARPPIWGYTRISCGLISVLVPLCRYRPGSELLLMRIVVKYLTGKFPGDNLIAVRIQMDAG